MKKIFTSFIFLLTLVCVALGAVSCNVSKKADLTAKELLEKNTIEQMLLDNGGFIVKETRYGEDFQPLASVSHQYYYDEGLVVYNAEVKSKDNTLLYVETIADGVAYKYDGNGNSFFTLLYPQEGEEWINSCGVYDLSKQTASDIVEMLYGNALLTTTYTSGEATYNGKYLFNTTNQKLERAEIERVVDNKIVESSVLEFFYQDDSIILNAKEMHLQNSPVTLNVKSLLEDGEYEKQFVLSRESRVEISDGYGLYKNLNCTKDLERVDYVEESATVYLANKQEEISFEYTLNQNDLAEHNELLNNLIFKAQNGEPVELLFDIELQIQSKQEYIIAQYLISEINFYTDMSNQELMANYLEAQSIYFEMVEAFSTAYRQIYESDYQYKNEFFADWDEEDLSIIVADTQALALQQELQAIQNEFNLLDVNADAWDSEVCQLFVEYIDKANLLADIKGYDNYYEYASDVNFMRDYSSEDLALFRSYLKEYIVPLAQGKYEEYKQNKSLLTAEQRDIVSAILNQDFRGLSTNYLQEYINSYSGSINEKFNLMFDKQVITFAENANALPGAFVNYLEYYEEGYVYFSNGYTSTYTVVHEMGHYASSYAYDFSILNYDLAETHSQANEWLLTAFLQGYLEPEVYTVLCDYMLYSRLSDVILFAMVDELEYVAYSAEAPYAYDQLDGIMEEIYNGYNVGELFSFETANFYWKYVTLYSPIYYISYATSELVSMQFYLIAQTDGYLEAQEIYCKLQEDITDESKFISSLQEIELLSPMGEDYYIQFTNFLGRE